MNFEIRSATYQHRYKFKIPNIIKLADRVSRKIFEHNFRLVSWTGDHPWNALDGLIWEDLDGYTEYIDDQSFVLHDIGKALYNLDGKEYTGVADVISAETTDIGTAITYRLKPKYAQMVKDDMEELKAMLTQQLEELNKKESGEESARFAKLEAARNGVANMKVKTRIITDEGGKTEANDYTVTTHGGKVYTYTERNVFDFGRVINPTYEIAPGITGGLLITNEDDNKHYWHAFEAEKGWYPVRPLEADEEAAYTAVDVLGRLANDGIRM